MADLTALFASLKPQPSANAEGSNQAPAQPSRTNSTSNKQPSVSSPLFSPSPSGPNPRHASAIMSPELLFGGGSPAPDPEQDRTASLLNLLKTHQPATPSSFPAPPGHSTRPSQSIFQDPQSSSTARAVSASDLVASIMRQPSSAQPHHASSPAPAKPEAAENPQDLLLKLLNQAKPAQGGASAPHPDEPLPSVETPDIFSDKGELGTPAAQFAREKSPLRTFGSEEPQQGRTAPAPFQPQLINKGSVFTYVNPFEQLSASSPRRTPKPAERASTPKVEILKHGESARAGASQPRETVAEALSHVGEDVDKQVGEALAQMDKKQNGHNDEPIITQEDIQEIAEAVHDAAEEIKQDLKDPDLHHDLTEALPKEDVKAFETVIDEIAKETGEAVADNWEDVEAEEGEQATSETIVQAFNFPMRPFLSIKVKKLQEPPTPIDKDNIMDIVRLKKEFDQIDRNLVTATKNFIVYALSKNGGLRLIRQDTGQYKQLFQSYQERIFNLGVCTASDTETVLGTGVNGTIFWTTVSTRADAITEDNLEDRGLVFPPSPTQDEYTSGTPLKTRAKPSSRHPEFFGVGRGKYVYIVFPKVARDMFIEKDRTVQSTEYLKNRNLKIATGKAGKDFAFSACDSVIATLDKVGKLKFWDIRSLTKPEYNDCNGFDAEEQVDRPLLTLNTMTNGAKCQPTSVLFVDKERPMTRGIALRYVIVGTKQNHTLTLWDLGLMKPVQELNLPHESDSDAICSVVFHPKTSLIVVGHPTRNSIYFIQLSAPRYPHGAMAQAKYLQMVVNNDSKLAKPDSTAIMSGIRELSFATRGQLRSLDMLAEPAIEAAQPGQEQPLFELYVMHSKGVLCLNIKPKDLGLDKDMKLVNPIDAYMAVQKGHTEHTDLEQPEQYTASEQSSVAGTESNASRTQSTPSKPVKREAATAPVVPTPAASARAPPGSEAAVRASTLERVENKQDAARAAIINGDKGKKKKKAEAPPAPPAPVETPTPAPAPTPSFAQIARREAVTPKPAPTETTPVPEPVKEVAKPTIKESAIKEAEPKAASSSEVPSWAAEFLKRSSTAAPSGVSDQDLKNMANSITGTLSNTFGAELGKLYEKFESDKLVQDAAGSAKQDAILRLVSKTLTDNVEKNLNRIVAENMQTQIVPQLSQSLGSSVDRSIAESVMSSLNVTVPKEIQSTVPTSLRKTLLEPDFARAISDIVTVQVSQQVGMKLSQMLDAIKPAVATTVLENSQQLVANIKQHTAEQLRQAEAQRQADAAKIDQLSNLVRGLSETVHAMAAAQTEFQGEILRQQRQQAQASPHSREQSVQSTASAARTVASPVRDPLEEEIATIQRAFQQNEVEAGMIQWLQSPNQADLFDRFFVKFNPQFIQGLAPLVALSVSAAVSARLNTHLNERLQWLEIIFLSVNVQQDPEVAEVAPKIMSVLHQRLKDAYMEVSEQNPANPSLKRIAALARRAVDLQQIAGPAR